MSSTNPKVDSYLRNNKRWQAEMIALRAILLDCQLAEELKWGKPCYTFQGNNIAILQGFKDSCVLMFFKGALLKDAKGILEAPGENSQAARRIPFTNVGDVSKIGPVLRAYIREAIEVEQSGRKPTLKRITEHNVPEELQAKLEEDPALRRAFEALTPGRQRAYLLHFSGAKQSKTRESRIDKCIPQILAGKGLND